MRTVSSAPYGPASALVRKFLVQFAGLGTEARARVVARYEALASTREFIVAERLLADAIERAGRTDARDALAGPLFQLVQRQDPQAAPASEDAALNTLDPVAEPALAALLALVVSDLLPDETMARLYEPFTDEIPRPR
jgi:hypothetical protein